MKKREDTSEITIDEVIEIFSSSEAKCRQQLQQLVAGGLPDEARRCKYRAEMLHTVVEWILELKARQS